MLQDIRNNSQSTAAKVVVGLIVVTFALFGVESIVGGLSGEPEVATVNGEGITTSTFERAVEGKRRQVLAQMGEQASPDLIDENLLRTSVLDGLIKEKVLTLDAEDKGIYISEQAVENFIRNVEQFQTEGVFSNERLQTILRSVGLTVKSYKESLQTQFMVDQVRSGLMVSSFAIEDETKEILALDRQTRDFDVATIFRNDYLDSIAVSDEDVAEYFESNRDKYTKPENVDVSYVVLDRQALASTVNVEEERVRTLYESEKESFEGEEQRDASHILVKIDDETDESAALEKINTVAERLKAGESFEDLAKEFSQDEGSASSGGALGLSGRGVYVSDFEDALYALAESQVSDPVKTEFGYHLIKVNAIEANKIPSFDEMKSDLSQRILDEELDQLYAEMSENLADISYSSPDLAEVSDELELEIKQLMGVTAKSDHELFSSLRVQKVLFNEELIADENNSDLIEVADGKSIVFRVNAYHEESLLPLESVKERVRGDIRTNKSAEYAQKVGESFIERINSGEDAKVVAKEMGLILEEYDAIKRDNVMLNSEVVSRVFTMKSPEADKAGFTGFKVLDGDYALVRLNAVNAGNADEVSALELNSVGNMIGNGLGSIDYQIYQDIASARAEVERL